MVRRDQTTAVRHVMKSYQQIRFLEILFSLRWYVEFFFAEPDTILVFKNFCGHFAFVSISEPKIVDEAFMEPEWIQLCEGVLD